MFVLAKVNSNTKSGRDKLSYVRDLEKGIIVALISAIFGFRTVAHFDLQKYSTPSDDFIFESVDIPEIQPIKLEATNIQAIQEAKTVVEEPPVSAPITGTVVEVRVKQREEAQLPLVSSEQEHYLLSESAIGSVSAPELDFRRRREATDGQISLTSSHTLHNSFTGELLNFDTGRATTHKAISDAPELSFSAKTTGSDRLRSAEERVEESLGIHDRNKRIIKFAHSTFGTEGYKLWNKISAEVDRLAKGRYGRIPVEIKRQKHGFKVQFIYSGGSSHEVNWRKDGNIWIEVKGQSNRTPVQELRLALNRLLALSVSNRGS